eukprot:Opistho-2@10503
MAVPILAAPPRLSVILLFLLFFALYAVNIATALCDTTSFDVLTSSNGALVVSSGQKRVVRSDVVILGGVTVRAGGVLAFAPDSSSSMSTPHILVQGELHIGGDGCPVTGKATITLTGEPGGATMSSTMRDGTVQFFGGKGIGVAEGGVLEIHGSRGLGASWTRLQGTISAGASSLTLARAVDWRAGDRIIIASTDFNMLQAEPVTIASVTVIGGLTALSFTPPVKYMHYGEIFKGVDMRAEVGLLSRSVVVRGSAVGNFGGQINIQRGFSSVHIEGAELENMGQGSQIGRYPVHFHMVGRVPVGTYVRDNSIHHSNFRCVVLHATHGLLIQSNVAYDHAGHCFFMEDGVEVDNVFDGNLGLVTRRKLVDLSAGTNGQGHAGLRSDWEAPTTFWITNPQNDLINNAAAGAQDTGIWYLFRPSAQGLSKQSKAFDAMQPPNQTPLGRCENNVVHSNRVRGFMIEPTNHNPGLDNDNIAPDLKVNFDQYYPKTKDGKDANTVISGLVVYKNVEKGAWVRGGNFLFSNCRFSDNKASLTLATAGTHPDLPGAKGVTVGGIFVGWSTNVGTWDAALDSQFLDGNGNGFYGEVNDKQGGATTAGGRGVARRGYQCYDGPQTVQDSMFYNFDSDPYAFHSAIGYFYFNTWQNAVTNEFKNIMFDGRGKSVWLMRPVVDGSGTSIPETRLDGDTNASFRDRDGSVTGYEESTVINNFAYFKTAKCNERPEWNAVICPYRYANLWIENRNTPATQFGTADANRFFVTGLSLVRDQHTGTDHALFRQDLQGATAVNGNGQKFRYQAIVMMGASYTLHFPYATPPELRIQLNNVEKGQSLRIGICYPPGTSNFEVRRGLYVDNFRAPGTWESSAAVQKAGSLQDAAFLSGDAYYFDSGARLLFVSLVQRNVRSDYWNYCPPEGCEQLFVRATIPAGSPITSGTCIGTAYPAYQVTSGPLFDAALTPRGSSTAASSPGPVVPTPSSSSIRLPAPSTSPTVAPPGAASSTAVARLSSSTAGAPVVPASPTSGSVAMGNTFYLTMGQSLVTSEGTSAGRVTLPSAAGAQRVLDQPPSGAVVFAATGLNGAVTDAAGAASFRLALDANAGAGAGTQASLSFDFDGDGTADRVETFSYFPTDAAPGFETYSSQKATVKVVVAGAYRAFANGSLKLSLWTAIGSASVDVGVGGAALDATTSFITLPY